MSAVYAIHCPKMSKNFGIDIVPKYSLGADCGKYQQVGDEKPLFFEVIHEFNQFFCIIIFTRLINIRNAV